MRAEAILTTFKHLNHYSLRERRAIARRRERERKAYAIERTLKRIRRKSLWLRGLAESTKHAGWVRTHRRIEELLGLVLHLESLVRLNEMDIDRLALHGWPLYQHDPRKIQKRHLAVIASERFEKNTLKLVVSANAALRQLELGHCNQQLVLTDVRETSKQLLIALRELASDAYYHPQPYLDRSVEAARDASRKRRSP
ncbi:MAG: hypothetical protein V4681_00235 [Patescibacteria group bacterium]